jgi:hypothetical protein
MNRLMMKSFLFTGALGLSLTAALPAFAQEQAPAPAHKDGQSWQFKVTEVHKGVSRSDAFDGIYELRVAGEKIAVSQLVDGKREPVTSRAGVLRELVGVSQQDDPDFKFPLSAGQKWSYSYQARAIGAKKPQQRQVEINVTGPEQVSTPAGTFKAFKVKKEDGGGGKQLTWVTIHYWSPETNSVVKSSYDSTEGGGMGTIREAQLVKFSAKQ